MKNRLLVLGMLASSLTFAQTRTVKPVTTTPHLKSHHAGHISQEKTLLCQDTLRYPQVKEQIFGTPTFYSFDAWQYYNESVSMAFLNTASLTVNKIEFYGGNSPDGVTTVDVQAAIYNVDASNMPTTLIGSGTVTISDTNFLPRYVSLSSPVTVTGNYAVVLTSTNSDGVVRYLINDADPGQSYDEALAGYQSDYYTASNGVYVDIPTLMGGAQNFEPLVAPIVSYTMNTQFTNNPTSVCLGNPVTMTNGTSLATYQNRFESFQAFSVYFGTQLADSSFVYLYGDNSTEGWGMNSSHTYTAAGTYTDTLISLGGFWSSCVDYTTQTVIVNPLDDATFSYPSATYCSSETNPVATAATGGTYSSTAGLNFVSTSTGEIDLATSTAGTYTVTLTTTGPCPQTSTQTVTITAMDDATFSYPSATYCSTETNPVATAATGGTYSSTAGLNFISASTGEIDLATSTAGTYTVTHTTTGPCPQTSTQTVTITATPSAAFSYPSSTVCTGSSNPVPTATTTGGTYSATTGLNFVDASTGEVDMTNSPDGTYTITYTLAGTCPSSSTQSLTITSAPDASFTYSAGNYCQNVTDPSPSFTTGSAGTFSSTSGLIVSSTGTIDVSASTPGTYVVTNTIAAAGSCPQVDAVQTVVIDAIPTMAVTPGSATICAGDMVTLDAATADSYAWTPATGLSSTNTATTIASPTATTTYTVAGTLTNGCSASTTVTVTVNQPVTTTVVAPATYCVGDSPAALDMTSTNGISGTWSPATVSTTAAGTTTYTFTPASTECATPATTTVTVNAPVAPTFGAAPSYCVGETATALDGQSTNGINGTWSPATVSTTAPGIITYTFTPTTGQCATTATTDITVNANPTVSFDNVNDLCVYNSAVTLTGAPAGGTFSGTGVSGTSFNPATSGTGTFTLMYAYTDGNGCSASQSQDVMVSECLGLDENAAEVISVYPNPATNVVNVKYSASASHLSVLSTDGKVLYEQDFSGDVDTAIDLSSFAPAMYHVVMTSEAGTATVKVIKK